MSTNLTIQDRIFGLEKEFNEVNSYKMNFIKEAQFALQLLRGNEYLMKAAQSNPAALEYAIINLASIGISLNPALKEAYLVPRGGKICLDISYIGLVKLATDNGAVDWVQAEIVREKDEFTYHGVGQAPTHKMNPFGDRGAVIGVYAVAKLPTGEKLSTIMSKSEVDHIRDKASQAAKSGPWQTFPEEMMKKTAIKRGSKLWPRSERLATAVSVLDEHEGLDNSPRPHMNQIEAPVENGPEKIRALLAEKGKTEEGLLTYINAASGLKDGEKLTSLEQLNSSQIAAAIEALNKKKETK